MIFTFLAGLIVGSLVGGFVMALAAMAHERALIERRLAGRD